MAHIIVNVGFAGNIGMRREKNKTMQELTATYSPEDNKLRLYSASRLSTELYQRVREAGFIYAPKQELFVAPMWTPERADLLTELCGEIGDEDTSLVERQEQRAERFEDYHENRKEDAERAREAVSRIADNIPLGQPILVGHHSERHARRDAKKIENGMRRAVQMWETAQYWKDRAKGAIRHAKYKELPGVRARRIKGLEADKRKEGRERDQAVKCLKFWSGELDVREKATNNKIKLEVTHKSAVWFCNYFDHTSQCFTLTDYPREKPLSQYEGIITLWSALGGSDGPETAIITVEQAKEIAIGRHIGIIADCDRWIQHINNRLEYERAMLDEQGASDLLKPKPKSKQLPLCNYRVAKGLDIPNIYNRGEMIHYPLMEMTQAEYTAIHNDYKSTRVVGNSHRVRTAMRHLALYYVFLTDAKTHEAPSAIEPQPKEPIHREMVYREPEREPEAEAFGAIKQSLAAGVRVVSANQLFPTPEKLADRMVDLADIQPGQRLLEPEAGTGNIVWAIMRNHAIESNGTELTAVEINYDLAKELARSFQDVSVKHADFLDCNGDLGKFDRILMNPPFEHGSDIKHIQHALTMLKPKGTVVAICANGSRQNEILKPLAATWEVLPRETFSGTNVSSVLLTIHSTATVLD
jgi:phospholipid N-methyltransferase